MNNLDGCYITVPERLTGELIDAVRSDPLCVVDDRDEMHKRIGWLICAWDAIIAHRTKTPNVAIEGPEQAQLANGPARMEGSA